MLLSLARAFNVNSHAGTISSQLRNTRRLRETNADQPLREGLAFCIPGVKLEE